MTDTRRAPLPWRRPDWHDDALCTRIHTGPDGEPIDWFPDRGQTTRPAKDVCAVCPVCKDCLAYAIVAAEKFGIYGCSSERQRRRLRPQVTRTHTLDQVVDKFWRTEILPRRRQLAAAALIRDALNSRAS